MIKSIFIICVGLFYFIYDAYNPITTIIAIIGAIISYQLDKIIKLLNEIKEDTSK